MKTTALVAILVITYLLTSCGQKGALYHPLNQTIDTPAHHNPTPDETTNHNTATNTDY